MALVNSHIDGTTVIHAIDVDQFFNLLTGIMTDQLVTLADGLTLSTAGDLSLANLIRLKSSQTTAPTIGSGGTGISAQSVIAGSTNISGQIQVTATGVAPGVVFGVVTFNGAPLASAPRVVVCSLSAPTAGVAAPPIIGADTYTTSAFTVRSYGPTTVTTGTYIVSYWCMF